MLRKILSVLAGLAAAVLTFLLIEHINASLHPVPADLDFKNRLAVENFYLQQPLSLWLLVLFGWVVGSWLCGYLIKMLSKSNDRVLPLVAASILTLSTIANFFSLPHPTWFMVVSLLLFFPATLLGHRQFRLKSEQ